MTNYEKPTEELATESGEKSVAVLFVDIEGCTRLCEDLLPKEMNELIEAYFSRFFDVVEKAGGTITSIMGDGFMAIFEKSEYGDNILGAAEAASSIQRQARELNAQRSGKYGPVLVNAGIQAGSAYVGFTKFRTLAREHRTYTASGPVTNIAARLCDLATNGSIFVSADVEENLKGTGYSLQQLGPKKLKNVSQPITVFKLEDKKPGSATLQQRSVHQRGQLGESRQT
jgi:class 3 adenylate cyclase